MIKKYPIFDGGLGSVSSGGNYPVYDPFSPNNNPSWVSPEFGGGGGGGTTQPFWVVQPNDPDPFLGPPQEAGVDLPPVPSAPVPPIKVLPPAAQTESDSGFDNSTVLIGAAVIVTAILLLKK